MDKVSAEGALLIRDWYMARTDRDFFLLSAVEVAGMLPGMDLVIGIDGKRQSRYMITETEAYMGTDDKACHASKGRTKRTEAMYSRGGHLYVYFVYGMHWMLNIVTGELDDPQAVLIRGVTEYSGPGRVTRGLGIDGSFNGEDITTSDRIWLEDTGCRPSLKTGPRIGIDYAGEPWISKPWRFVITDNKNHNR